MNDLKEKIIKKVLEFRDSSLSMGKVLPMNIDGGALNVDEDVFKKNLKEDSQTQTTVSDIGRVTQELFELLDELDVVEGRGLKR